MFHSLMSRIRSLIYKSNEPLRLALAAVVWVGLHVYAARPLLIAAAAEGIAPLAAWSVVLLMPFVSILPLVAWRTRSLRLRSLTHWTGYASISVFSILFVLVLMSDVVRVSLLLLRASISVSTLSFATLVVSAGGRRAASRRRHAVVCQPRDRLLGTAVAPRCGR
jgi:hypothetical protein